MARASRVVAICLLALTALGITAGTAQGTSHHGCATTNPTASDANAHANVARDCETLLSLKAELAGDATLDWDVATAMTEWDGVAVNLASGVTSLSLPARGLSGVIPAGLGGLTELQQLLLSNNQLSGPIPSELGELAALQVLWLQSNQLTGTIPPELGSLTNLTELILHGNDLSGRIPPELGSLAGLTDLLLHENDLSGRIPSELGGLTNLTKLELDTNRLSGSIPSALGSVASLTQLRLNGNDLSGQIPSALGSLASLTQLALNGNNLSGRIPSELGSLASLTQMFLHENNLSGQIPPQLGDLRSLTDLYLQQNQLSGFIPPSLGNLAALEALILDDNRLSGEIPRELGQLAMLQSLQLHRNRLQGPIPTQLGDLAGLDTLILGWNQLSGSIPPELGDLAALQYLYLNCNRLTGAVPSELGDIATLQQLWLYGNQLDAELPASLSGVTVYDREPRTSPDLACSRPSPPRPPPTPRPGLDVALTAAPDPVAVGGSISYRFTVTNTGDLPLTGVFWGSPELDVGRRSVGDGTLAVDQSAAVTVTFGPVTTQHLPGPIIIEFFADSDQTDAVAARSIVAVIPPAAPSPVPSPAPTPTAAPTPAPVAPASDSSPPTAPGRTLIVERTRWSEPDAHLRHNTPDLRVLVPDQPPGRCGFLAHYDATGGLPCWGYAISEVLEERPGVLTQYYQRGVLDCRRRDGGWQIEPRLAWDYLGGGLAGAPDLGAEPHLRSIQPGLALGPWGHRVSNLAMDGTSTGFLDFFQVAGGVAFFGFPKSAARADAAPDAHLRLPDAPRGVIRQYFQAGVLEYHPADAHQPVKLALLGDAVRDRLYPDRASDAFASFGPAAPLAVGQVYEAERVISPILGVPVG